MLKAVMTKGDGTKLILLGLEELNIQRLKEGKPIHVEGEDIGFPGIQIGIIYGETQQAMIDELKKSGVELPIDRAPVVKPGQAVVFRPGEKKR